MARGVAGVAVPISSHRGLVHTVRFGPPRQLQTGWLWSAASGQMDCLMAPRRRELPKHRGLAACNQGVRQC